MPQTAQHCQTKTLRIWKKRNVTLLAVPSGVGIGRTSCRSRRPQTLRHRAPEPHQPGQGHPEMEPATPEGLVGDGDVNVFALRI
jgi:hypothetical protein